MKKESLTRCAWAGTDPFYVVYHDKEWGVPVRDDRRLFEFLILEGAQAGLSWATILRKRENYRRAFDHFDPTRIVNYGPKKIHELLANEGIVRNRLKIKSAIGNARAFLKIQKEFGTFERYIWEFVGQKPIQNRSRNFKELPAKTEKSDIISKDLKGRGFNFVGSTIMYAFMQAVGMVNDHATDCFRHAQLCQRSSKRR